jgi:hypothetical protein
MARRRAYVAQAPCGQTRRPMRQRQGLARALCDAFGQVQGLVGFAVVKPGRGELGVGLVTLEVVEQALQLGAFQHPFGLGEIDAAQVAPDAPLQTADLPPI